MRPLDISQRQVRVRASESAIRAALQAMQDAGLAVEKLCVNGGKVEIHCGAVDGIERKKKDEGLEKW